MADSILSFQTKLDESARSNLWKATISFPSFVSDAKKASDAAQYLVISGNIPQSEISEVEVNFRGRIVYEAGERTYSAWECSIYNDIGFTVRKAFEEWSNMIRTPESHGGVGVPSNYKTTIQIEQLDRSGNAVRRYTLNGAWVQSIGEISLDYTSSEIEKYNVTIRYDYFTADKL